MYVSDGLPHFGVLAKRQNESSWFLAFQLRPILHCVFRKFAYLQNEGTSPGTLLQTLDLENSRRRVDGIVIKTRRRSSLWTTPVMVERRGRTRVAYYTSVLRPSNSITSFCCGFDVQLVPTVLQPLTSFHRWPAMMVIPFWQPTIV